MATLLQFPAQPATEDRSRQSGSTALKARKTGFSLWIKSLQAVGLAVVVCFSLGATDPGARFNDLGHRMMCTCSCAQLLGECNHVGCSFSGQMRQELSAAIAGGSSDKEILASFSTKYGPTVLAAPTAHGFDLVAWIAPFAVLAAALAGTVLLIRRWAVSSIGAAQDAAAVEQANQDPEARALHDKIRRETGGDGGF